MLIWIDSTPSDADTFRLALADQNGIGLELHAEQQRAGVFQYLEKILAQQNLTAAQWSGRKTPASANWSSRSLDLRRGHLAVIVVVEITMNALFVAAIGQVQLHAERNPQSKRLGAHLLHQGAHFGSCPGGERSERFVGESTECRVRQVLRPASPHLARPPRLDIKLRADLTLHDLVQRRRAVRRFPDERSPLRST